MRVIVWPKLKAQLRGPLLRSKLMAVKGTWQRDGDVRNLIAGYYGQFRRMLVARVEGWKRSGDLDPDVAPADAAEALQSLILGYIVQTTITRDVSAEAHARALCAMISGADRAGEP